MHPDSKLIACGDEEGEVKFWELAEGGGSWKEQKTLEADDMWDSPTGVNSVVFSPDGRWYIGERSE